VKSRYPDKTEATILLEPQTPYDTLVQVMDRTRVVEVNAGLTSVQAELFPGSVDRGCARAGRRRGSQAMSMSNRARRMLAHQVRNKADAELNLIR